MGFRDWFRRKPASLGDERLARPRPRYYAMAHVLLRQVGLEDPLFFLGILASPGASEFFSKLLEALSDAELEPDDFDVDKLRVHPLRVGVFPCAVVEFPQPRAITEAYYTALVALIDPADGIPEKDTDIPARYITLEFGMGEGGAPRTVLGEWTGKGVRDVTHANYGDGPEPTLEAFVAAVKGMIDSGGNVD
ncbi:MAG TPA: hypothetical protein VHB77_11600 [Planctomycetaceae bacterium]|nr:hypothetical protein [Planctomycetaceae bacterium]